MGRVCNVPLETVQDVKFLLFGLLLGPLGRFPLGAHGTAPAARVVDVARDGSEHLDSPFCVVAVVMGHGTPIAYSAGRFRLGKLKGDRLDLGRGHAADLFRPLGGVLGQVALQSGHLFVRARIGIVGRFDKLEELLIVETRVHDFPAHGQSNGAIRARLHPNPFRGLGSRVGDPHVKGDHLHAPVHDGIHQPLGGGDVVGVALQDTAPEVEHVIGLVKVPVVVVLAPGQLLRRPLPSLADGGVVANRARAIVVQEHLNNLTG